MTETLADTAATVRARLVAARLALADATAERDRYLDALTDAVLYVPGLVGLPERLWDAAENARLAAKEVQRCRSAVDELVRDAAIAAEVARPDAPSSEQRARVEALIAARVLGLRVETVGDGTSPRRWRIAGGGHAHGRIPHYASDMIACREAEALVDGLTFVRVLINGVLALDRHEGRREVALAVLGAAGVDPADDPCVEAGRFPT